MRSPAAAVGWEFLRRHRWGVIGIGAYAVALVVMRLAGYEPRQEFAFALVAVMPLTASFMYCLAVFSFGISGDLAARQSTYPSRMFTLPVTSGALALWPMVYGAGSVATVWLAVRLIAVWPREFAVPVLWPALLAAVLLAWTQALTWMPYGLPGLRVVAAVVWLATIDTVVMVVLQTQPHELTMLALLAPHLPAAYLVARSAVARARRGEVPDWRFAIVRPSLVRRPFRSAAAAQTWFEWRRHGRALPAMVAMVLPFELALLALFRETPAIVFEALVAILLTPVFMAAFAGRDAEGVTRFTATRPMTNGALIAAKLRATIASTAIAWLIVLASTAIVLRWSGTWTFVVDAARDVAAIVGGARAIAIAVAGFAMLAGSTWKQLVQTLYIAMSGRRWLVRANVFATLVLIVAIGPVAGWIITDRHRMSVLWRAVPSIAAVLIALKLVAAWSVLARLDVSGRMLLAGAIAWNVAVFALFGVFAWILPSLLAPRYILLLIAILEVPLARLAAAPLALGWSRHR